MFRRQTLPEPVTHDEVTSAAIKSPSKVKTTKAAEDATSVPARAAAVVKVVRNPPTVEGSLKDKPPVQAIKAPAKVSLEDKNRPAAIEKPAAIDDLKLIAGVGSKIEIILHELGIYTYAQVAAWKKAERDWVDSYLDFKGRIERDDWVKQAKALAKGGEAEYVKVFGKKPEVNELAGAERIRQRMDEESRTGAKCSLIKTASSPISMASRTSP